MSDQSRGDVINQLNAAYRAWDLDGLKKVLAEDVAYHIPGTSPIGGDYVGRDAVLALWAQQREYMEGRPFMVRFVDILESDLHVVAVTAGEGRSGSRGVETRGANIYTISDGQITECWPLYGNMEAFDQFWSEFVPK